MTDTPKPGAAIGAALVALRKTGELICAHCGKTFTARRSKKEGEPEGPRYHSASCRTLAYRKRVREKGKPDQS